MRWPVFFYTVRMVYILPLDREQHLSLAEPFTVAVPRFRSGNVQTVLIQHDGLFTHVAQGTQKHSRAKMSELTLTEIQLLRQPIPFLELPALIPRNLRPHALRVFRTGGLLPPKTSEAVLQALNR